MLQPYYIPNTLTIPNVHYYPIIIYRPFSYRYPISFYYPKNILYHKYTYDSIITDHPFSYKYPKFFYYPQIAFHPMHTFLLSNINFPSYSPKPSYKHIISQIDFLTNNQFSYFSLNIPTTFTILQQYYIPDTIIIPNTYPIQ